jgi:hypothetical protein
MKNNVTKIFAVALVITGTLALAYMGYSMVSAITVNAIGEPARAEVVGDAPEDALEGFEDFTKGDPAFNLGVNIYGKTIFVDNTAALKATSEKCDKAIQEMRSQAPELRAFKKGSIYVYTNYIWQINWDDVNEEVYTQSQFLSLFLQYYENGDPHQ